MRKDQLSGILCVIRKADTIRDKHLLLAFLLLCHILMSANKSALISNIPSICWGERKSQGVVSLGFFYSVYDM